MTNLEELKAVLDARDAEAAREAAKVVWRPYLSTDDYYVANDAYYAAKDAYEAELKKTKGTEK